MKTSMSRGFPLAMSDLPCRVCHDNDSNRNHAEHCALRQSKCRWESLPNAAIRSNDVGRPKTLRWVGESPCILWDH